MSDSNMTLGPTLDNVKTDAGNILAEVEASLYKLYNIDVALVNIQQQVRLQRELVNEQFAEVRKALAGFENLNVKIADVATSLIRTSGDTQALMSQVLNDLTGGKILHVDGEDKQETKNEGDIANERQ